LHRQTTSNGAADRAADGSDSSLQIAPPRHASKHTAHVSICANTTPNRNNHCAADGTASQNGSDRIHHQSTPNATGQPQHHQSTPNAASKHTANVSICIKPTGQDRSTQRSECTPPSTLARAHAPSAHASFATGRPPSPLRKRPHHQRTPPSPLAHTLACLRRHSQASITTRMPPLPLGKRPYHQPPSPPSEHDSPPTPLTRLRRHSHECPHHQRTPLQKHPHHKTNHNLLHHDMTPSHQRNCSCTVCCSVN
jgi:hypothetical protein